MSASLKVKRAGEAAVESPHMTIPVGRFAGPLQQLIEALSAFGRPLATDELVCMLQSVPLTLNDVQPFVRFNDGGYCRQTVYVCDEFEISCLSWRCGQFSAAHDHGDCCCCVRVMQGTLTNVEFNCGPEGRLSVVRQSTHRPCELIATAPYSIHQAGNAQQQDLVTLHVYSPRL